MGAWSRRAHLTNCWVGPAIKVVVTDSGQRPEDILTAKLGMESREDPEGLIVDTEDGSAIVRVLD